MRSSLRADTVFYMIYTVFLYHIYFFMSGGVWMGSEGAGDVLIQNNLAQIYIGHVSSDVAFYSSSC